MRPIVEDIWLTYTQRGITKMTKNMPDAKRGERLAKLRVTIQPSAFRDPTLVREVEIVNPLADIPLGDLEFTENVITEAEAVKIRRDRLAAAAELLSRAGYQVQPPTPQEPADDHDYEREGPF